MHTSPAHRQILVSCFFLALLIQGCGKQDEQVPVAASPQQKASYIQPKDLQEPLWLPERNRAQLEAASEFEVFHQFSFTDKLEASGIDFMHRSVDDAGKFYKMVHYDHGNGLSIADVDNDGLYDVYFTNQVGPNSLWRNLGNGTFEDITQTAGVGLENVISVTSSFADIDNDGDQDLFVTTVRFGNYLFENNGAGRFTDISAAAGLNYSGHSSGAIFFDYDRDGLLDLFLTNVGTYTTDELAPALSGINGEALAETYSYYVGIADSAFLGHHFPERFERNILYRNLGQSRFRDVSEESGLINNSWSGDATVVDANEDGWPDLYILDMQGHDVLFENQEGKFVDKTTTYFPQTSWGAMGVKVLDYNNDGKFDLFVTDMHSDMWETNEFFDYKREKLRPLPENVPDASHLRTDRPGIYGNALFRNEGNGVYTDVAINVNAETYWPWGVSSGDLNADGFEDLFVSSSMNYPFRYHVNSVLLNNQGQGFLDSEFVLGVEPRRDDRTAKVWFYLDCLNEPTSWCEENGHTYLFDVWGALGTRSSVIFDLDNDGDLDIVTNDFNSEPMVLISNLSEERENLNYLSLKLVGSNSNHDALGAVVTIHTPSFVQSKVYDGKSGYLSQSSFPLYFGLGEASRVDRIEIQWPSGAQQVIENPETNRVLRVVEG